ncbi:MAG TPA: right-handed parallel beta-helix repeat-containing protein [Tepidisphaeraceae bacterium]|nr:right-handed parallel beta-helix repeat-containing protein [Tepidisphaeraceae bacterium]
MRCNRIILAAGMLMSALVRAEVHTIDVAPEPEALPRAIQAARQRPEKPVILRLAAGMHVLNEPLVLTSADSKLTIEAAAGATPVISGGRRISGWRKAQLNGADCWAVELPEVRDGNWFFRELWVNGKRATRARHPNSGTFAVVGTPDPAPSWQEGHTRFTFKSGDVPAGPFAFGAEVLAMTRWVESRLPIRSVDLEQNIVSFWRLSQWALAAGDPYWLEGDPRWLDAPGEWHLDREHGTLYYRALPGQAMDEMDVVAPALTHLIELRGAPERDDYIENLTFRGVTFAHAEWMHADPDPATTKPVSGGFSQAARGVPAAVGGEGVRNSTFEGCVFAHLGTYGLDLGRGSQSNRITRCTFRDLGAGGIKLGSPSIHQEKREQTFGNVIEDCDIGDGGHLFPSAVGIWVGQASDNRIAHNHIHDFWYTGISLGWTWGYGESLNVGNLVERNHIHHIGQPQGQDAPILADMGAVYTIGARTPTIFRGNHIHDVMGRHFAWGIYLDEGASDVIVEDNLVYRTQHGGFHQHYGKDNLVRNNIFAYGRDLQVMRSLVEDHHSFTFVNNVVCWESGSLLDKGPPGLTFDRNLYGPINEADFRAAGMTWEQWRGLGMDVNSTIADPMFVDPQIGDFTTKPGSPVERMGLKVPAAPDVGPRALTLIEVTPPAALA